MEVYIYNVFPSRGPSLLDGLGSRQQVRYLKDLVGAKPLSKEVEGAADSICSGKTKVFEDEVSFDAFYLFLMQVCAAFPDSKFKPLNTKLGNMQ